MTTLNIFMKKHNLKNESTIGKKTFQVVEELK